MQTHQGLDALRMLPPGSVLSIGNFDGVHLGHQSIFAAARALADRHHAELAIATFEPHPFTVLRPGHAPPRLTPPARKAELIAAAGADQLILLPPSQPILDLAAEEFWRILCNETRPAHLVEGNSFNFGKNRAGTIDQLRVWAADSPIQLTIVPPRHVALLNLAVVPVNSSLIRWLLANGRARDAAICLGRPYELTGTVIHGHHRGRTIGIPTANLDCKDHLIPDDGVYAGRCTLAGQTWPAAISIGAMPTFGANARQVEAHLIGHSADLYGQTLRLELLDFIRDQRRFPDIGLLKQQLARDIAVTTSRATLDPAHFLS